MLKPPASVHSEYRFSALEVPPPADSVATGAHASGLDMCNYMERYYDYFLKGKIEFTFNIEVLDIFRDANGPGRGWFILKTRIILATGVSYLVII
jgi:hypothetical protein